MTSEERSDGQRQPNTMNGEASPAFWEILADFIQHFRSTLNTSSIWVRSERPRDSPCPPLIPIGSGLAIRRKADQ